jgi:hypothetical protein
MSNLEVSPTDLVHSLSFFQGHYLKRIMNVIAIEACITVNGVFLTLHIEICTNLLPQYGVCFPIFLNTCTGSSDVSASFYSIESLTLMFSILLCLR